MSISWLLTFRMRFKYLTYTILKSTFSLMDKLTNWALVTLITITTNNYINDKVWVKIAYSFLNLKGCAVEVREWISNFTSHFIMDIYCSLSKRCADKSHPNDVITCMQYVMIRDTEDVWGFQTTDKGQLPHITKNGKIIWRICYIYYGDVKWPSWRFDL